jgi:hypothetical protein
MTTASPLNGGAALTGKSGRKSANVGDTSARQTLCNQNFGGSMWGQWAMTMPDAFDRFLLVALVSLAARALPAAEQASADSATVTQQLKALSDPTILQSSLWLDTEWEQFKHGAEEATWTLGALWAWRVTDRQDLAVRLHVPFVYDRSDKASGHAEIGGIGDIEVATGTAFRLSNTWRTGGGIELHADSASNPVLSSNVWRLHPSWSVAHDVTHWLTVTFTTDYYHSIAEEHDALPQRYLQLSLPTSVILPQDWSITTNYKAKVNFENGERWTHTVDLGVAKRLPHLPLVLSATFEKPTKGGNERFEVDFTITYYFQK